jgi:hypothetical protein
MDAGDDGLLRGLDLRIELRCLPAIEHAVIADDANAPMARRLRRLRPVRRPRSGSLRVSPGRQEQELAGVVDALEDLVVDKTLAALVKPQLRRQQVRS